MLVVTLALNLSVINVEVVHFDVTVTSIAVVVDVIKKQIYASGLKDYG